MPFAKPFVVRGCFRLIRGLRPSTTKPQAWRQIGQRGYASHGHEAKKAGGDLPWAIGAVVVTAPATWYLIQNGPGAKHGHNSHGDHGGHGNHGDEHNKHEPEKLEDKSGGKEEEKLDESTSEAEDKGADTPDASDDESSSSVDSGGSKELGDVEPVPNVGDKAATPKSAGSQNVQSSKQEGMSNIDTKHSTDVTKNPEKSKESEGVPSSAKPKGTVDPKRTQV